MSSTSDLSKPLFSTDDFLDALGPDNNPKELEEINNLLVLIKQNKYNSQKPEEYFSIINEIFNTLFNENSSYFLEQYKKEIESILQMKSSTDLATLVP